jgi:hypothetical protein
VKAPLTEDGDGVGVFARYRRAPAVDERSRGIARRAVVWSKEGGGMTETDSF